MKSLERIAQSKTFEKIVKGITIAYATILIGGAIGVIAYSEYREHIDSKTKACQEMECQETPMFDCNKTLVNKKYADHCVINEQGIEECCVCTCDYTMY